MAHVWLMTIQKTMHARLERAIAIARHTASSDFDLNAPDVPTFAKTVHDTRPLTPAAVLVALLPTNRGWDVVLTKRTSALRNHPGQIAFPGGRVDATDADIEAAALREAHEEIGLPAHAVRVLGQTGAHHTITGFDVTPVIAEITAPFVAVPAAGEVAEVFHVPWDMLMNPANTRIEGRIWQGHRRHYYTMPYGPYYIWGATARMLVSLQRAWGMAA